MGWRQVGRVVAAFIGTALSGRRVIIDGGQLSQITEIQMWSGHETPAQYPAVIREYGTGTGFNDAQNLEIWATEMGQPPSVQLPGLVLESYPPAAINRPAATLYGDVINLVGSVSAPGICGTVSMSFTTQTSFQVAVTFPEPFATPPVVMTNIATGSGVAGHWSSRATTITNTGFNLFVFSDTGAAAMTWSNIPVQWLAFGT